MCVARHKNPAINFHHFSQFSTELRQLLGRRPGLIPHLLCFVAGLEKARHELANIPTLHGSIVEHIFPFKGSDLMAHESAATGGEWRHENIAGREEKLRPPVKIPF